jgi:hypothetical protein
MSIFAGENMGEKGILHLRILVPYRNEPVLKAIDEALSRIQSI